jgi:hypothetical protein
MLTVELCPLLKKYVCRGTSIDVLEELREQMADI